MCLHRQPSFFQLGGLVPNIKLHSWQQQSGRRSACWRVGNELRFGCALEASWEGSLLETAALLFFAEAIASSGRSCDPCLTMVSMSWLWGSSSPNPTEGALPVEWSAPAL